MTKRAGTAELRVFIIKSACVKNWVTASECHQICIPWRGVRSPGYSTDTVKIHDVGGGNRIAVSSNPAEPDAAILKDYIDGLIIENQELKKLQALISDILEVENLHGGFEDD